jgi:hypothetical protein
MKQLIIVMMFLGGYLIAAPAQYGKKTSPQKTSKMSRKKKPLEVAWATWAPTNSIDQLPPSAAFVPSPRAVMSSGPSASEAKELRRALVPFEEEAIIPQDINAPAEEPVTEVDSTRQSLPVK